MTYIEEFPSCMYAMPVWYPECWSVCILIDSLIKLGERQSKKNCKGILFGCLSRNRSFLFLSFLLPPSLRNRINGSVDGPSGQVHHFLLVAEGGGLGSVIFRTLIHTLEPVRSMCVEHYP